MYCTHAHSEDPALACHLLVNAKNYTPYRQELSHLWCANVELQFPEASAPMSTALQGILHFPEVCIPPLRKLWAALELARGRRDPRLDMAPLTGSLGCLLRPVSRSAALLGGRWLQPWGRMGLPDPRDLPVVQQNRGKARGNEYQPSNIKRKHKHGWIRRLSTPAGVQVILRRMLKGRKSLSH
ncbi:39S ribosomal protein L34, mitochondrial [Talpa occidentalis]|uniref:39S ribosomal protein L34, mitochondrial n=1 Tax=Talpa occidentalis TaxID=50954 RepID=UPI0023FA1CE5|nr:39S ribosomal protein L34, mitochondrial [Talpa occidentalis]